MNQPGLGIGVRMRGVAVFDEKRIFTRLVLSSSCNSARFEEAEPQFPATGTSLVSRTPSTESERLMHPFVVDQKCGLPGQRLHGDPDGHSDQDDDSQ